MGCSEANNWEEIQLVTDVNCVRVKFCGFPAPQSSHAVLPMIRYVVALGTFSDPKQGTVYRIEGVGLCDTAGSCLISTFRDFSRFFY